MPSSIRDTWRANTLVYDGDCDLCRRAQGWISEWDRGGRVRYLSFQDPQFIRWFPEEEGEDPPKAVFFIDRDLKRWEGVEAFRRMLPLLPFGKFLAVLFYLPGAPWASRKIYEWVAVNRYRFRSINPRGSS